ncbi:Cullin-domain-containing protein [Podospora didyma]|uniref:Cullin-domain-containing protein n=1 Tax=Podospora didyma TaxID=330526 RepID=A0AAE0N9X6_9PEZI|nr:Cullin-domain-containing protein [Podospora didyma]
MPSTTSGPSFDGPANPSISSSTSASASASAPPKRRHRVGSDPDPNAPLSATEAVAAAAAASSVGPDSSAKRARSDHYVPPPMSARAQGKRPDVDVIDLTRGGSSGGGSPAAQRRLPILQPHMGPRKLVIKNLRPASQKTTAGVEDYYARTLEELDAAVTTIFQGRDTVQPMERLYRGVEDICRKGDAASLADKLRARCDAHLNSDEVLGGVRAGVSDSAGDDLAVLRAVLRHWKTWSAQLLVIRWIYSYLDRSHLLNSKTPQGLNDMGINLFRKAVFGGSRKELVESSLGARLLAAICQLVGYDRRGDDRFNPILLKESVTMLRLFGVYGKLFEPRFLSDSRRYFTEVAEERSVTYSLKDYILATEKLLNSESERCDSFNFDSTTKRQLRDDAHHILIQSYSEKLLDTGSVAKLLEANDATSMKALYDLLRLSGIQKRLKGPWEEYVREAGSAIVSDTSRGDEMIVRLLVLRKSLDTLIRNAFAKDEVFTYGLREAFGYFVNDKKSSSPWNTGTSKVGEMIAKYIDMLLRGGLKTLPKTLLSDSQDRADAERSGLSSTADEDAELDRQLDHAIELFRFIEGKDVFEAFYKKDLARRLLLGRSSSQDGERNMLQKLKSECGSSFTHNLEQMFKDQELAKDEMNSYRGWLSGTGRSKAGDIDLTVDILSAASWPTFADVRVLLPKEVVDQISTFDSYYKNKHTGRRLTWKHNLAHCVIKAQFNRGPKELAVSALQAVVLVLFNDVDGDAKAEGALTYNQILQATSLPGPELDRTLQSLACGKVRVLLKHPKGRDVKKTDTFTVNKAFTDPKYRVKINQVQLKETREENKETHERVAADRQFETQAAIVRIMKSRKTMTHVGLVTEVINQTKSRGAIDPADIKLNIEKLIEKDYIEREGGSYVYLA